jgi:hypothetical protein
MYKFSFCIAVLISGFSSFSQGPTISAFAGYGFSAPSDVLGIQIEPEKTTNIYGTLGAGMNYGLSSSYMLKPNFGMELGFSYFQGTKTLTSRVKNDFGVYESFQNSNQFRLMPSLILQHSGEKLGFYFKPGLVLPISNVSNVEETESGSGTIAQIGQTVSTKSETKYFFAVGYSASIGGTVKLTKKLSLFGELNGISLKILTKSKTMTSYVYNGIEDIDNVKTVDKITSYDDQIDTFVNNDENVSKKALSLKHSYSAIFLNVGLKFSF